MDLLRIVRAVGGLLSIVTLLGLIVADFMYADLVLRNGRIAILLLVIGALLGIDTLIEESINIKLEKQDGEED